jgi:hypothetical protein
MIAKAKAYSSIRILKIKTPEYKTKAEFLRRMYSPARVVLPPNAVPRSSPHVPKRPRNCYHKVLIRSWMLYVTAYKRYQVLIVNTPPNADFFTTRYIRKYKRIQLQGARFRGGGGAVLSHYMDAPLRAQQAKVLHWTIRLRRRVSLPRRCWRCEFEFHYHTGSRSTIAVLWLPWHRYGLPIIVVSGKLLNRISRFG